LTDTIILPALDWLRVNGIALASAVVTLVIGWHASRVVSGLIRRLLPRAYGVDKNFAPLLAQAARYGIIIFAVVTALNFLGIPSASIYALALQNTLANIAAGLMLVWLRPIAIGEYITGDGVAGVVVEIGLFGTRLRSTSGLYIFTPNQKLWNSAITNHSREPRRRIDVNVTIPDTADVALARKTMLKVATSDKRVEVDPRPDVHVEAVTADKIVLQLRAWVPTPLYLEVLRDMTEKSKVAINKLLADSSEIALVETAVDPHTQNKGEQTPNL
jgi:small conductance mechanosensitive channel